MNHHNIAEIEISYSSRIAKKYRIKVNGSKSAYNSFLNSWNLKTIEMQEEFKILLLNNSNEILGIQTFSKGSTNGTVVDIKLLFATALKACASSIIIAHNHPSGNLSPSEKDIELTKKINQSAKFLDIKLLDHLIVTREEYTSFADQGLL